MLRFKFDFTSKKLTNYAILQKRSKTNTDNTKLHDIKFKFIAEPKTQTSDNDKFSIFGNNRTQKKREIGEFFSFHLSNNCNVKIISTVQ